MKQNPISSFFKQWAIPFSGVIMLMLIIAFVRSLITPEPLTNEQIIEKNDWTNEELATVLSRQTRPSRDAQKHLNSFVRKLPEPERKNLYRSVINTRVQAFKEKIALVDDKQKQEISKKLLARAKKESSRLSKMSDEEKKEARSRMKKNQMRGFGQQIGQEIINRLSPDERRLIAPAIAEWTRALESL